MDNHWKDVVLLLRGEANIGVVCDALIDIIDINLHYLPDVFHEVSFALLTQASMSTRINASLLLGKLCSHFSSMLIPLICDSSNDGVLIQIEDIDIESIARCHGSILYNVNADTDGGSSGNLYTQDWLKRQRNELLKQIGLHSYSADLVSNGFLEHIDMGIEGFLDVRGKGLRHESNDAKNPSENEVQISLTKALTNETWLARIMRCMIAGLMSPQWECRHGYSIGLNQMIDNLSPYPHPNNGMPMPWSNRYIDRVLPEFLSNDILSCGLCVLLLDRFMDFDSSNDCVLSPVKESVGELLSTALRSALSTRKCDLFWKLVTEMMLSDHHWTISLGGLIACRHFIVIKFDMVFFEKYEDLMTILQSKLDGARGRADEYELSIEITKLLLVLNNEIVRKFSTVSIEKDILLDEQLFACRVSIMTKVLISLFHRLRVLDDDAPDLHGVIELERMTSSHLMLLMDVQLSSCSSLFHLISYSTVAKGKALTESGLLAVTEQLNFLLIIQSDLLVHANLHKDCQLQIHCFSKLFRSIAVMRDILKLRVDLNGESRSKTIANHGKSCFILFGRILAFISAISSTNGSNDEPPILNDVPVQPSKATRGLMKTMMDRSLWSDSVVVVVELLSLGFSSMYRPPGKDYETDRLFRGTLTSIVNIVLTENSNHDDSDPTASSISTSTIDDKECIKSVNDAVHAYRLMFSSFLRTCDHSTLPKNMWARGCDQLRSRFIIFISRLISYIMSPSTSYTINLAVFDNVCMTLEDFSRFICKSCQVLLDNCKLFDEKQQSNKSKKIFSVVFITDTSTADEDQPDVSTNRKVGSRKRRRPMDAVDESIASEVRKRKSPRDALCYELESLLCFCVEVLSTLTNKMVGSIEWQSIVHDLDHAVRVVSKGTQRAELCMMLRFLESLLSPTTSELLVSLDLMVEDDDHMELSGSFKAIISNSIVKSMTDFLLVDNQKENRSGVHDVSIMIEQLMQLGRYVDRDLIIVAVLFVYIIILDATWLSETPRDW